VAPLAWIAFGLWVIGVVATVFAIQPSTDTGWTVYTPYSLAEPRAMWPLLVGPIALASAGILYACHLAAVIAMSLDSRRVPQLVTASLFVLLIAFACIKALLAVLTVVMVRDPLAILLVGSHPHATSLAAAVVLATAAIAGDRGWPVALVAIACGVLSAFVSLALLPLGIAGLWIALAAVNGFRRPAVAAILFGAVPAMLLFGIAPWLGGDLHVHDTYIETGRYHLAAAIIAFAGFATILVRTNAHPKLAWVGTWLCGAGVFLHGAATLYVGASGMPRRYWQYDPTIQSGHQLAGIGAAMIVPGVIVLAIAWLRGSRSKSV
jgi:heme/copper-type cytochrome/quinol oxidase subunit 1